MSGMFFGKAGYTVEGSTETKNLTIKTWKGINTMRPARFECPAQVDDIIRLVIAANESSIKIKCIGAGHSFTTVALVDDGGLLLSLEKLDAILALTEETITVQAGCTLNKMVKHLKEQGKQLAACPEYGPFHAGAFSGTQLHESAGNIQRIPTLSSYVTALTVIKPDGKVAKISAENDLIFWRTHQGNAGIVVDVTFKIAPLDHVLVEYDLMSWDKFWPQRDELPKSYDEYFSIYIPLLDIFFIERRKYVKALPASKWQGLKIFYGTFLRKSAMVLSLPWFYAGLQSISSYKVKKSIVSFGVDKIFRALYLNKTFMSIGSDRAIVFKKRPSEIYNDSAYTTDQYPLALAELREFVLQDQAIAAATLIASYRIPADKSAILSRTFNGPGYSVDPVLYAINDSPIHLRLENKLKALAIKYKACPHLNKSTHLNADLIRNGYDHQALTQYIDWCKKMDPKELFCGPFLRMLIEAAK